MNPVKHICDSIGRRRIEARLGVKRGAITSAIIARRFPAAWFKGLRELADEQGVELDEDLFYWREASSRSEAA